MHVSCQCFFYVPCHIRDLRAATYLSKKLLRVSFSSVGSSKQWERSWTSKLIENLTGHKPDGCIAWSRILKAILAGFISPTLLANRNPYQVPSQSLGDLLPELSKGTSTTVLPSTWHCYELDKMEQKRERLIYKNAMLFNLQWGPAQRGKLRQDTPGLLHEAFTQMEMVVVRSTTGSRILIPVLEIPAVQTILFQFVRRVLGKIRNWMDPKLLQEKLKYLSFLIMVRPVMQAMTSLKPEEEQANVNACAIVVVGSSFSFKIPSVIWNRLVKSYELNDWLHLSVISVTSKEGHFHLTWSTKRQGLKRRRRWPWCCNVVTQITCKANARNVVKYNVCR